MLLMAIIAFRASENLKINPDNIQLIRLSMDVRADQYLYVKLSGLFPIITAKQLTGVNQGRKTHHVKKHYCAMNSRSYCKV